MRAATIAAIVCLAACSGDRPTQTKQQQPGLASLGGSAVARVGTITIDRTLVREVARAQHVTASIALSRLIDDVLLAEAAQREHALDDPGPRLSISSILARHLLDRLRDGELDKGPFTDEEIAAVMPGYWVELDRPELRTVIHALVDKKTPNGAEVAKSLRESLAAAKNEDDFRARAQAFKPEPRVEKFAIVADGRFAAINGGSVLEEFTKGSFGVTEVPGTSDVVVTSYGWHVIRVLDKQPPLVTTREQKIAKMQGDLVARRLRVAHDALIKRLDGERKVQIVATDNDLLLPQ